MTVLPDPRLSDEAWARVIAARERGETAHREIAAYVRLHGLRISPTPDAYETAERIGRENQYNAATALDPYTGAWIVVTITGGAQIIAGSLDAAGGISDRWSYPTIGDAVIAWQDWLMRDLGMGEPDRWVRHQPSDRRRVYGVDGLVSEEVRP